METKRAGSVVDHFKIHRPTLKLISTQVRVTTERGAYEADNRAQFTHFPANTTTI